MERAVCKHCGRYAGFSRNWTFGGVLILFIASWLTMGVALLLTPWMYPKRCLNCGQKK